MTTPRAQRDSHALQLRSHGVTACLRRQASIGAVSVLLTVALQGRAHAAGAEPDTTPSDGTSESPAAATAETPAAATTGTPAAAPAKTSARAPSAWSSISDEKLAQDPRPPSPPPRPPKPPQRWYGWQILLSDVTTVALFVNGTGGRTVTSPTVIAWALVPPAIHALHDRGLAAAWSLGLRVAVPLIGNALYSSCRSSSSDDDATAVGCVTWPVLVAFAAIAAMGVDASNAYEDIHPRPSVAWLAPGLVLSERHRYFGLVGSF